MNMIVTLITDIVTISSSSPIAESRCSHVSLVPRPGHFDPWGPSQVISNPEVPTRSFSSFLA